jgi:hypothetical protein
VVWAGCEGRQKLLGRERVVVVVVTCWALEEREGMVVNHILRLLIRVLISLKRMIIDTTVE